jgi:hypothetical protein
MMLVLWLQASASLAAAWARPVPPVTVGAVSGRLWVRRNAQPAMRLLARQPLYIGDIIETGERSKATILFPDGAQARLNANASIQITGTRLKRSNRQSLFRIITGQVAGRLRLPRC